MFSNGFCSYRLRTVDTFYQSFNPPSRLEEPRPTTDPPPNRRLSAAVLHSVAGLPVPRETMERSPWWMNIDTANLPTWSGPVGIKTDGGGSIRGQGRVGSMRIHRAVHNKRLDDIVQLVDAGADVNEVEAAGNTPLHSAAFEGWLEGAQLLLQLGAKVNASNNAGDTPWHWATNMGHTELAALLEANGASKQKGQVLVQEHVPKVKDFYSKECWAHHPPPYADFIDFKKQERAELEAERKKLVHV